MKVDSDSTTRLINLWPSMRTSYPPSTVNALFYGYSKLQLQRNVERDVDRMTGIELATLQLRRPRTNRLNYVCCDCHQNTDIHQANEASCCRKRGVETCNICLTQKLKTGVLEFVF